MEKNYTKIVSDLKEEYEKSTINKMVKKGISEYKFSFERNIIVSYINSFDDSLINLNVSSFGLSDNKKRIWFNSTDNYENSYELDLYDLDTDNMLVLLEEINKQIDNI